jgi:hypothetical protein
MGNSAFGKFSKTPFMRDSRIMEKSHNNYREARQLSMWFFRWQSGLTPHQPHDCPRIWLIPENR